MTHEDPTTATWAETLARGNNDDPHRGLPVVGPLRAREHAPVCRWCSWSNGTFCNEPTINPTGYNQVICADANSDGKCVRFRRWWLIAVLQFLRVVPFVERPRKQAKP